jgi:hypothetical protein
VDDLQDDRDSRAPTAKDVAQICEALNKTEARYLLIGGFAVIAHGGGRTTKDIDFLVDASETNIARVKSALQTLPDNAAAELEVGDVERYTVVRIADEIVIDLLAKACGVTYEDAVVDAELFEVEGVDIPIASKSTLIRTKQTVRPSDLIDCRFLYSQISEEDGLG